MTSAPDLTRLPAHRMAARLRAGALGEVELLEEPLARIEATEPQVHAWIRLDAELAREAASDADRRLVQARAEGPDAVARLPALIGLPVALKDLVIQKGRGATA